MFMHTYISTNTSCVNSCVIYIGLVYFSYIYTFSKLFDYVLMYKHKLII